MATGVRVLALLIIVLATFSGCSSEDSANPPASKKQIRLMAYNIKHGRGMDGKVDLDRIARVISQADPDLVALQEIDKNCERSGNRDIAARLGQMLGMHHRFAKFMDYQGGEYGMAVLSKLPIKKTVRHQLPDGAEPRCSLEIQVDVDGLSTPLSFVCIHNDWTKESIRVQQVTALVAALKDRTNPMILAGDFNGERDDQSLGILLADSWVIDLKDGANTFPSPLPIKEIDFFIFKNMKSKTLKTNVVDEKVASDHRPIIAEFNLPLQ